MFESKTHNTCREYNCLRLWCVKMDYHAVQPKPPEGKRNIQVIFLRHKGYLTYFKMQLPCF